MNRNNPINALAGPERTTSLAQLMSQNGLLSLDAASLAAFDIYLGLLLRWNARTNLTAIRDADGILQRHFLESIACAQMLPGQIKTLLDFGSGAGFPGIPIAICRPDIEVTLAESQNKKAAFLREVVSVLKLKTRIFAGRAETMNEDFDCVTMRAVDRMENAVSQAATLVHSGGSLVLMSTTAEFSLLQEKLSMFDWRPSDLLPGSDQRVLRIGVKRDLGQ
jgi:16S rRNA (guanine527-N7)-methyltransferase